MLVPAQPTSGRRAGRGSAGVSAERANLAAALSAGFGDVVGVLTDERSAVGLPEGATLLLDEADAPDEASSLRVALDYAARSGHDAVVVALHGARVLPETGWEALSRAAGPPVRVGVTARGAVGVVRLAAVVWSLLPLEGRVDLLWRARPELASTCALDRAE